MNITNGPAPAVVGEIEPWMGGPFGTFDTGLVNGLVMVRGRRLDILAITSRVPGDGNFRRFLNDCKAHYDTIGVWEIINRELPETLARHGFVGALDLIDGEMCYGMRWDR